MGVSGAEEQTPGRVVAGRYRVERVLGRGGMGVVWLAVDTVIERRVALKELRAPTGVAEGDEASFMERAIREARNAGRLNHPDVVAVYDVIAPAGDDAAVYIVMEYVQAPTLEEIVDQQGPLPAARVATMGLGILNAVMAAHTMGIVHRDIKPGNVLVRDGDRVKLTDFGIALAAEDTRLTRSGVIGTQPYLAPECFDGGQGAAADLWALGATLFHAVAGRSPFERDTATATLRAILFEEPPAPPCEPHLAEVITGLLTRPVDQRLTGDAARPLLQRAADAPSPPAVDASDAAAAWDARATTVHPFQAPARPAQLATPSPYAQPTTGLANGGSPTGPPMPWIVGGALAAVAVVLALVLVVTSGGDSDGGSTSSSDDVETADPPLTTGPGSTADAAEDAADQAAADAEATAEGEAAAREFLDAIHTGDEATATGILCPNSPSASDITAAISGNANLEFDPNRISSHQHFASSLSGTVGGEPVSFGMLSLTNEDTGWCVDSFEAS